MPSTSVVKDMAQKIYDDEREYTEVELQKDKTWIEASRTAYKAINGSDFTGTDEEAASEGLGMMGEFNYNLALGTIPMAAKASEFEGDAQLAFYYMMDAYDKKDISWNGVGRFLKGVGTDPTTYVGLSTLGIGLGAKETAKFTAREGLKKMLKTGAQKYLQSTTAVAATEGAAYLGAEDVARQEVAIQAGVQEEYDPTQTAVAAGIGAAGGAGLVQATKAIGRGIGKAVKSGEEAMAQAAGGGTPPVKTMDLSQTKAVDRQGKPITLYHATDKEFEKFDISKGRGAWKGVGAFFSSDKEDIASYGENVIEAKVDMRKPLMITTREEWSNFTNNAKKIKDSGKYDGVIYKGETEAGNKFDTYVVFESEQIERQKGKTK